MKEYIIEIFNKNSENLNGFGNQIPSINKVFKPDVLSVINHVKELISNGEGHEVTIYAPVQRLKIQV